MLMQAMGIDGMSGSKEGIGGEQAVHSGLVVEPDLRLGKIV
jgi:hypothetical protein